MRNPLAVLFERRSSDWGGPVGSLIRAYLDGSDTAGGVSPRLTTDQAMRVAAFSSCVRLIATNVAALPLGMFKRLPRGREEVQTSLSAVLAQPNGWQTGQEFREQLTGHILLRGNAYAWVNWVTAVDRDGRTLDQVKELIPLHPDRVEVEQDERTYQVRYFLTRPKGERVAIPAEEMLHIRGFSTDGLKGRSILDDARETVGGALASQRFASRLFENDATPGVVLSHPKTLTEAASKRIREQWDDQHRGHTRRTAVLEEGMTLDKLSITPNDAQFLETRQLSRGEIAGLFPVPPHLIGDVDRSTSWGTGIEQQQIAFLQFTLLPILNRWENTIERVLIVREQNFFVKHTVEGFLRGDSAARAAFYKTQYENDAITPNEIRAFENMNPLPNGDRTFSEVQAAMRERARPLPAA